VYVPITDDDVPAVAALMNRAYRGAGGARGWAVETDYLAGDRTTTEVLRADLAAAPAATVLKWVDWRTESLSGCVWLEPLGGEAWYLGSFAIEPDRQNGGLGRIMLAAAEDWVRERGGRRMRMTVINLRSALIAWYLRRGYHKTGETEPFPYGDDRFGDPLRDDLGFVVLEKDLSAN
jgi:GNAT superfamily N-acetyltransferase